MPQKSHIQAAMETPAADLSAFVEEVNAFLSETGMSIKTLSRKALDHTYTLERMLAKKGRVSEQIAAVRAEMAAIRAKASKE